ncbi:glycoside hydrolase family 172 protein [Chitinophaga niabensis]|uniref:DUF2961 domain-containing protein n=1 Tax=Chitinophaga niabensis TaxID=536979 RepID=A0A1N6IX92_9BACT|nr:glycoside hydrolase family 172 protein [Chitinophaga niabensis]SIO36678.1 Protein of unknown function [Chitinophaga niabensis]
MVHFFKRAVTSCLLLSSLLVNAQEVSLSSLLREMSSRKALASFPNYLSLQASSYNRASVSPDSAGWFADSDGTGFIRQEGNEWVVMEHQGPGAITKMWAPYFYYGGLDDLEGPMINIYLDGQLVISENFFKLITGRGSVPPPFAAVTARAGNSYLPVPFAKSCKITFNKKPFYNIINYRGYPSSVKVKTFTKAQLVNALDEMDSVSRVLHSVYSTGELISGNKEIQIKKGGAIHQLEIMLDPHLMNADPSLLRSTILVAEFDGEQTIWAPLGDFFGSANALNPFQTWTRTVNALGQMICTWVMPFKSSAKIYLTGAGAHVTKLAVKYQPYVWNERSMHFHASWLSDEILAGSSFKDMNFIDIRGKGVIVGDAITVLNPDLGWWGEGDEKIYVDNARFPTHFGTGTEDYYGWAGGENPTKDDVFSHPYLANIAVGTATKTRQNVRGFNICTRVRALDAIPFTRRLVFDMEASPGVDIRNAWDFLGYSAMVYWYALPGAVSNRGTLPVKPIMTLREIDSLSSSVRRK